MARFYQYINQTMKIKKSNIMNNQVAEKTLVELKKQLIKTYAVTKKVNPTLLKQYKMIHKKPLKFIS